jgi:predicted TIM-barrel fold metal-dependent hydrolase
VDLAVILFDLADSPMWPFLCWTLESIGLDRVLLGSDFPDYPLADTIRLARRLGLDEQGMALVLGENAARLFEL